MGRTCVISLDNDQDQRMSGKRLLNPNLAIVFHVPSIVSCSHTC